MGQKVNPFAIRLGITRDWVSKWYANKKQFPIQVHTDFRVREFLKKKLADASVSRVLILLGRLLGERISMASSGPNGMYPCGAPNGNRDFRTNATSRARTVSGSHAT